MIYRASKPSALPNLLVLGMPGFVVVAWTCTFTEIAMVLLQCHVHVYT